MNIFSLLQNMTIAAYIHHNPDAQVRKMAKRYKKLVRDKRHLKTMSVIIKSPVPAKVVIQAYNSLME